MAGRLNDVLLVDAFLAREKKLSGPPPEFGPKTKHKQGPIWDATWPIANADGVVESGALRVNYAPASDKQFSLVIVFREQCVARVDFVDQTICHSNPFWAHSVNAEPTVCGPHFHSWEMNRDHVSRQPVWDIPCRVALPPQVRRFNQAFPWLADRINLTLVPEDREFDLPLELV